MPKPMISREPGTDLEPVTFASELLSPIAQAVKINPVDPLWDNFRLTSASWQREAWRFYHCIPELHFAANYIGAACSRVRIFVQHLNKYGVPDGEVTEDLRIAAIADTLFGGPAAKAQALKMIGVNQTIAGQCFIVGRAKRNLLGSDKWAVVSTSAMKRNNGGYSVNLGGSRKPEVLLAGTDLVLDLWNPDDEYPARADSPTQACLNVLAELEELMLYEFSQIDSRLSGAGVVFLPAEMSNGPSDSSTAPQSATDVFNQFAQVAQASRRGRGTAAGVVPNFLEIPGEYIGRMQDKPMRFDSELSDKLTAYKESAVRRLATGMNMPAEILTGMGDVNHISVWSIEESFVKIHIEPMMNLICDGLTQSYLKPLILAMGKDPDRYTLAFDTAPLTVRASRLQDTINLYNLDIVSAEEVLLAGNYNPLTAPPSDKEQTKRFVRELMLRDPTLVAVPALVEAADLDIDMPEPALAAPGEVPGDPNAPGPPPPPTPEPSTDNQRRPVDPRSTDTGPSRPAANQGTPILASGADLSGHAVYAAANVVVRRALEIAGGRLLTRDHRGRFPGVAKFDIHTKIRVTPGQAQEALAGAFDHIALDFAGLDVNTDQIEQALHSYTAMLLVTSTPHNPAWLKDRLNERA